MWSKYESVASIPPGYRFAPTDEELILYLRNKVLIKSVPSEAVKDIDADELYSYPPYEIVEDPRGERGEWYFFIHHKNYQNKHKENENIPMAGNWTSSWKKENWIGKEKQENGNFRMIGNGIGKELKEEQENNWFGKDYNNENRIFGKEFQQENERIRVVGNGNGIGFWKSVGKEDLICNASGNVFALKIHFIYFSGSIRRGKKTHWRMEEYHLIASGKGGDEQDLKKEEWVLGRITRGRDYS